MSGRIMRVLAMLVLACITCAGSMLARKGKTARRAQSVRLLYWNIQNGMWDGQTDDYRRFTSWVDSLKPDVCVWCEAQSIWRTNSDKALPREERQLPGRWPELAARYGHTYIYIGEHRDNYPQVITSRFPLTNVKRLGGNADTLVAHGAGWAQMQVGKQSINLVALHTWPQAYAQGARRTEHRRAWR